MEGYNDICGNYTTNSTESTEYDYLSLELPNSDQVIMTSAFTVNMFLSIVGNVILLCALLGGRKVGTNLSAFIVNLALADLTMAIFCMPFTFPTIMLGYWIFGTPMCHIVIFLQHVSVIVSIGTSTAVGIDRYIVVMYPLRSKFTKIRMKIIIFMIWLVAILLSLIQAVLTTISQVSWDSTVYYFCSEWYPSETFAKVWEVFFLLITYFIPLAILTYTYTRVARRLWGRNLPGNADATRDRNHARSKRKVVKMLVAIVVMFALCWLPLHTFKLITVFYPAVYDGSTSSQDRLRIVNACVLWVAMSNSFVNPFIYGFLNNCFVANLKVAGVSCCRRRQSSKLRSRRPRRSSTTMVHVTSVRSTRSPETINLRNLSYL
ncbi:substance-P receptor-like [Glandiceps talaboti]